MGKVGETMVYQTILKNVQKFHFQKWISTVKFHKHFPRIWKSKLSFDSIMVIVVLVILFLTVQFYSSSVVIIKASFSIKSTSGYTRFRNRTKIDQLQSRKKYYCVKNDAPYYTHFTAFDIPRSRKLRNI
jgi:hypothetical protein